MLTIFSIPKPFTGHSAVIQTNAVRSWTELPGCEVLLFGDDEGVAEAAAAHGARHISGVVTSEAGTPRLDWVFERAQESATHETLCYVNADVILMDDLPHACESVPSERFLLIGKRWDVRIEEPLGFGEDWREELHELVRTRGILQGPAAIDYFAFPRGLWGALPPFFVGRPGWDNWMIFNARARKIPVIDATDAVMAVHQEHRYGHHPGGKSGIWRGEEARANLRAAGGPRKVIFSIADATWILRAGAVAPVRNHNWSHLRRAILTQSVLHTWLLPLYPVSMGLVSLKKALWPDRPGDP